MLTKTSETAIKTLLLLVLKKEDAPFSPRQIAESIGASPTYMAKVCGLLVKNNIVKAIKGVKGGVYISRPTGEITLLEVVEACQGRILGDFCEGNYDPNTVCAFHKAMKDLHDCITKTLRKWTIKKLVAKPVPSGSARENVECRMNCVLAFTGKK